MARISRILLLCLTVLLSILLGQGASANPHPVNDPVWTATPPTAPPCQPIGLSFCNATQDTVILPNTAPWWITDESDSTVYAPWACMMLIPVPPGGCVSWVWGQQDDAGNQVAPGKYTAWIRWYEGDWQMDQASAPIHVVNGVAWSVEPHTAEEQTEVNLILKNATPEEIVLENSAPWSITDIEDGLVFAPMALPEPRFIDSGDSATWSWEMLDLEGFPVPPDRYVAKIDYRNSDGSIYMHAEDLFTVVPSDTGDVVWMVTPRVNSTKSIISMTLTNATNDSIYLPDTRPWWIEDDQGSYVYSDIACLMIVPVPPGVTMAWAWREHDQEGDFVPAGTYFAKVSYSRHFDPWDPEEDSVSFLLVDPEEEGCIFVAPSDSVYIQGDDVDFHFTNCVPDTIGMLCYPGTWWIATQAGQPIYWPLCQWTLTMYAEGEGFDFIWPQTMNYNDEPVPPGTYYACVAFTDEHFFTHYVVTSQPVVILPDPSGVGRPSDGSPGHIGAHTRAIAPNPFSPQTSIRYTVDSPGASVEICVFDLSGRLVDRRDLGWQPAGGHSVSWAALSARGEALPSGTYLCHLQVGEKETVHKLVVLR